MNEAKPECACNCHRNKEFLEKFGYCILCIKNHYSPKSATGIKIDQGKRDKLAKDIAKVQLTYSNHNQYLNQDLVILFEFLLERQKAELLAEWEKHEN